MATELTNNIHKAIEQYDTNCGVKELAGAIADILKESYGKHTFQIFKDTLEVELNTDKCGYCNGTGKVDSEHPDFLKESCITCNGRGKFN